MIERHSVGDARASVMADDSEAVEAEPVHQADQLGSQLAFAEALAVVAAGGGMASAVAAQIGRDNRVRPGQDRNQHPPAVVGFREAVQQ
jgi:hypothetical protein